MTAVATIKMSSKGQVLIPETIRHKMGWARGSEFVVIEGKDGIFLKMISSPSRSDIKGLLSDTRSQARKAGLKKSDVASAILRIRRRDK